MAILLTVPLPGVLAQERDWSIFLPQHPSRHLVTHLCLTCHGLQPILNRRGDYRFWENSIRFMNSEGADIRSDEMAKLSEYLSTYFGPDREPLAIPVELNSVTREEIELIYPIADQAEAILRERDRREGFKDVQELLEVEGITRERFEEVRPFLYVEDAP